MKDKLISEHRFVEDLYGCLDGFDFDLEDVLNVLKGVEPVDAVQVVRCKDCKNRECVHDPVTGEIRNDMFFCKIAGYSSRYEFFCGDGERKDGEHNETQGMAERNA